MKTLAIGLCVALLLACGGREDSPAALVQAAATSGPLSALPDPLSFGHPGNEILLPGRTKPPSTAARALTRKIAGLPLDV